MSIKGDQIELTILMPCLNEAETIETCIKKAHSFLNRSKVSGEILIADNGSTDGSQEIALRLNARVIIMNHGIIGRLGGHVADDVKGPQPRAAARRDTGIPRRRYPRVQRYAADTESEVEGARHGTPARS